HTRFSRDWSSDVCSSDLTAVVSLAVGIYSTAALHVNRIKYGYFFIFHFLIMGLLGAFLTGDIFNLYVWFEVVIISSFVLLTLGRSEERRVGKEWRAGRWD